jgi:hypothetical protein
MDLLTWIQDWYLKWCDGSWEHEYNNIRIGTLDNPGWCVDINLLGTDLQQKEFTALQSERSEHDWIHCWVQDNVFRGAGGPLNLKELLETFYQWASLGSG